MTLSPVAGFLIVWTVTFLVMALALVAGSLLYWLAGVVQRRLDRRWHARHRERLRW